MSIFVRVEDVFVQCKTMLCEDQTEIAILIIVKCFPDSL